MPYTIDLNKLKSDCSSFDYKIDDAFFDGVENSLIHHGELEAKVIVEKKAGDIFHLSMDICGNVAVPCDRCLDDVIIPINVEEEMKVKLGRMDEETDEFLVVTENNPVLEVGNLLYDYIVVAVPIQHVHDEGQCNEDMVEHLKNYLVEDIRE